MFDAEPIAGVDRSCSMRIREENRNIVLLGAVTLCCVIVAGTSALLEPMFGQANQTLLEQRAGDTGRTDVPDAMQVRVVGAPFVPNVNPRQR